MQCSQFDEFFDRCVIARRTVVFYSGTGFVSCSADYLVPRRTVFLYRGAGSTWSRTEQVVPRRTVFFSRGTPTLAAMVQQRRRQRRPWCSVFYNLFDRGLFQKKQIVFSLDTEYFVRVSVNFSESGRNFEEK